jgi:hypothetical protein
MANRGIVVKANFETRDRAAALDAFNSKALKPPAPGQMLKPTNVLDATETVN